MTDGQFVDEAVSRRKFDREIARYREQQDVFRKRGWFLVQADFPRAVVVFATPRITPPAIVCAVRLDFTNYDLIPPSVTFVDPFTGSALPMKSIPFQMLRLDGMAGASPATLTAKSQAGQLVVQNLIQAHSPEEIPFLCLPGVREYHDHPAHTGDSWLLHRRSGEGSLHFILDHIWASGVNPVRSLNYQVQVSTNGFSVDLAAVPR